MPHIVDTIFTHYNTSMSSAASGSATLLLFAGILFGLSFHVHAHPAALLCRSDSSTRLQVPVRPDTIIMKERPVAVDSAEAHAHNVSLKVLPGGKRIAVAIPDGMFFAARIDNGGSITFSGGPTKAINKDGCDSQVITPSSPSAGLYYFDVKVTSEDGSKIVLGFADRPGVVSLLQSATIPQNAEPTPSPSPRPLPPMPSPSPSKPVKPVGHGSNISLGNDMYMDFSAVGQDEIEIVVRLSGTHAWIGVGLSQDGTMGSSKEGSELFVCDSASGGKVTRYWSTASGRPEKGEDMKGSSCSFVSSAADSEIEASGATTMTFTRKLVGSMEDAVRSRSIVPGTKQSIISAHGYPGTADFSYHGPNNGHVLIDFANGSSSDSTKSPALLLLFHILLMGASWGALLPWGAALANRARAVSGRGEWFKLHRTFQYAGWMLQVLGFVVIFANVAKGSPNGSGIFQYHFESTHAKLGLVVVIVGTLQPLNALIRPHPLNGKTGQKSNLRRFWELWHKGAGWLAILGGLVNVLLGILLLKMQSYSSTLVVVTALILGLVGVLPVVLYFTFALASPRKNCCSVICVSFVGRKNEAEEASAHTSLLETHA